MKKLLLLGSILAGLIITSCSDIKAENTINTAKDVASINIEDPAIPVTEEPKELSEEFKKYWYAGSAEITSYQLEQARYGEIREGKAVLIYVTEDFASKEQVKADRQNDSNIPVMKLNATKKFNTGIYPYSIMQSVFYPVSDNQHAIKVSNSMQEWCGHIYSQLNNREQYDITSHSYFQREADQDFSIDKDILENELWAKIRINPDNLPQGELDIIPSFEYSRLKHKEIKAFKANASLKKEEKLSTYTIVYPDLNRNLSITFNNSFPHEIESWTETFKSGFGAGAKELTTKATKIKRLLSPYWGKNSNKDEVLREELGL